MSMVSEAKHHDRTSKGRDLKSLCLFLFSKRGAFMNGSDVVCIVIVLALIVSWILS